MTLPSKKKKVYGPYPDKSKGGRMKMTIYDPKTQSNTGSTNAARYKKEKELGKKLPKNVDVDHKDNNKKNESSKNLKVMSHSDNVAKENRHRKKK